MPNVTEKKRRRRSQSISNEELESWVKSATRNNGCKTCSNSPASQTIKRLLEAMIREDITHITLRDLHLKTKSVNKNYHIGFWGFREHLYKCERHLYNKARGIDQDV